MYQKRFKKERKFRRKIEQDLLQIQQKQPKKMQTSSSPLLENGSNGNGGKTISSSGIDRLDSPPSLASPPSSMRAEDRDGEMTVD